MSCVERRFEHSSKNLYIMLAAEVVCDFEVVRGTLLRVRELPERASGRFDRKRDIETESRRIRPRR